MEESATMIRTQNRKVTDTILYRANNQKWHCQITWAMRFCHFWNECLSGCKIFELNYFCLFPIAIGLKSLYYAHLFWDVKCWSHVIACSPNSQMLHSICNSKKSPFRYMTCSFGGKKWKNKLKCSSKRYLTKFLAIITSDWILKYFLFIVNNKKEGFFGSWAN